MFITAVQMRANSANNCVYIFFPLNFQSAKQQRIWFAFINLKMKKKKKKNYFLTVAAAAGNTDAGFWFCRYIFYIPDVE